MNPELLANLPTEIAGIAMIVAGVSSIEWGKLPLLKVVGALTALTGIVVAASPMF